MDSIAVTKPDMAVMKRDRLGLSLFGLLSLAFGDEVRTRSDWQTGLYREVPLDLLEAEEQQPVSGEGPAVQLNVDLKVVLETLKKEQQHADQRQRKAAERILERHTLLTRYFVALGVDEATAQQDACRVEHDLSDITFEKIREHAQRTTDEA